jgi:type I restriction-modification system DNA methylase subunit
VDNLGSLIKPQLSSVADVLAVLQAKDMAGNLFLANTHAKVLQVLHMAEFLSPRYAVVVANPPYMGSKGMNGKLSDWAKTNYPKSKSDLFAMFIERGFDLTPNLGYSAMVTMQSWMFLSSYEALRERILSETAIECMAHMGNMVMGIAFGTAATVLKKGGSPETRGAYCYVDYDDIGDENKPREFPPRNERNLKAARHKEKV